MAYSDIDFSSRPGSTIVNLNDREIDDFDSIVSDVWDDGTQVYVPPGTYDTRLEFFNDVSDATLIGDPEGVTLVRPDYEELTPGIEAGGEVVVENFTVKGQAGSIKSRISAGGGSDGKLTFRNFNMPDGTVSYSDAYAFNDGNNDGGTLVFEKCYLANFGNSTCYVSQGSGDVHFLGTTIVNANTGVRAPDGDLQVLGCRFIWTGEPSIGCWGYSGDADVTDDPDDFNGCGTTTRGIRNKDVAQGQYIVKDTDFYISSNYTEDAGSAAIQLRDGNVMDSGEIANCRFWDEKGDQMAIEVRDDGYYDVLDVHDLHLSGGSEIADGFSDAVVGNDKPTTSSKIWTPGKWDGQRPAEGDGDTGGDTGGDDGGDTGGDTGDTIDDYDHHLAWQAAQEKHDLSFTASGEIIKGPESEESDAIVQNDDGTYTATSVNLGNNAADDWYYNGDLLDVTAPEGYEFVSVLIDGENVTDMVNSMIAGDSGGDGDTGDGDTGDGDTGDGDTGDGDTGDGDTGDGSVPDHAHDEYAAADHSHDTLTDAQRAEVRAIIQNYLSNVTVNLSDGNLSGNGGDN